jgi:hypothetical protein
MRYFKIDLKTYEGETREFSYSVRGVESLISHFNDVDMRGFVSSWTVEEFSDSEHKELISSCGSNHPINAGAIFWTIFDETGIYEETLLR